ncbi:MAG: hypothetical protein PHQ85_03900 [Eubacteriales bacterium]|jgi:hypothetical protein|nr:hypothetical protein [Eubacteriales bacterium]MDD4105255.1 hypothetical protein [Eubacteriales bacterium]MDD4710512.1 hypothetical protein [Eubacteriales bacterium]NLO16223.1 hypothetical protein [Clostridiales bacterium]
MPTDDYFDNQEEDLETHKDRMRFAAGMSDFFAVILGVVVILVLVGLVVSLINWLRQDIINTFRMLETRL